MSLAPEQLTEAPPTDVRASEGRVVIRYKSTAGSVCHDQLLMGAAAALKLISCICGDLIYGSI